MLLLYFVAAGVAIGLLARGDLDRLAAVRVSWAPVAIAGLVFQVVLFSGPVSSAVGSWGPALYVGSTAIVLLALLRNLEHPGFRLIALGAALNLVAILAYGGQMPASVEAYRLLTGHEPVPSAGFSNSVVAPWGSPLLWLGDVFVLPRPIPLANVFSIGDVFIGLGGCLFIVRVMGGTPPART